MKYQHTLNDKILFETDDALVFMDYLITNPKAVFAKKSIFYNLLLKNDGYICNMVSVTQ
jgi:hypothetical protein